MPCKSPKIIIITMPPARRRILPTNPADCTPPISPGSSSITTPMERNTSVVVSPTQRTTRSGRRASPARTSSVDRELIRLQDAERHWKHKETLLKEQVKYKKKMIRSLVFTQKRAQNKLELVEAALQIEKDELRERSDAVLDLLRHYKLNYSHTSSYLSVWANKSWDMLGDLEKLG
jgi:hypothetical protein